ncbi:MAG TPA: hypothetical protein VGB99_13385 [Acidobacteriota bacterium]
MTPLQQLHHPHPIRVVYSILAFLFLALPAGATAAQQEPAPRPEVIGAPLDAFLDVCRTPGVPPEDIVAYIDDVGGVGFEVTAELLEQLRAESIPELILERLARELPHPAAPAPEPPAAAEPEPKLAPVLSLDDLGALDAAAPAAAPPAPRLISRPTVIRDPVGRYLDLISTYEVSRGEGVTAPRLVESRAFSLPTRVKQMMLRNQRYVIHLRVHVAADGAIRQYDILRMTPTNMPAPLRQLLEQELEAWVAGLRYEPARYLGQPIETYDSHLLYISSRDLVIPHGIIRAVFQ